MAVASSTSTTIEHLQRTIHDVLAPLMHGYESFVLFDVPIHNNVGDSAIFLGELAYMRKYHGNVPAYMCRADRCDYRRLASRDNEALLLMHGGGNFGDLWPWHHERREALIRQFPGRRIVQLPQTVKFGSAAALDHTRRIISEHGNFVLLVRDERSFELASAQFECTVLLCADTAFCIGTLERPRRARHELLVLLREDRERAFAVPQAAVLEGFDALIVDWPADSRALRAARQASALGRALMASPASLGAHDRLRNAWLENLARRRVEVGLELLSCGRALITDRLHACILGLLLDMPCAAIDNNYGKISGFIAKWLADDPSITLCASLEVALAESDAARHHSMGSAARR